MSRGSDLGLVVVVVCKVGRACVFVVFLEIGLVVGDGG